MTVFAECADNLDFMGRMAAESTRLIISSPPYNVGKSYERRISLDVYLAQQARVIEECVRVLSRDGSICWQVGHHVDAGEVYPLDILTYGIFKALGLRLRNRIVWHFEHGLHCKLRLSGRHETVLWFTKSDSYSFNLDRIRVPSKYPEKKFFKGPRKGQLSGNPLGKNPGDVWIIPNVKANHVEKTIHPCQFPVELAERFVLSLSSPGDTVFDPYMGVGSTLVAAAMHGRAAFGCDLDNRYVQIARERLDALAAGTLRTRPMGRSVFVPVSVQQQSKPK